MKLRVLGGLSLMGTWTPLGGAFSEGPSKKGERGEAGDILGEGVRLGSDSW